MTATKRPIPVAAGPASPAATAAPHEQLGGAFKAAMASVRRLRGRETHQRATLSYAQYGLLFNLVTGRKSIRELAAAATLTPATVTQMLDALALQGLVDRTRCAEDKRVVFATLTKHGEHVVAERRSQLEAGWRAALERFSDADLLTAAAVLDRLTEYFDDLAGAGAGAPGGSDPSL